MINVIDWNDFIDCWEEDNTGKYMRRGRPAGKGETREIRNALKERRSPVSENGWMNAGKKIMHKRERDGECT